MEYAQLVSGEKTMKTAVALIAFLSATITVDAASLWDHNGSIVYLEVSGASRKFYYQIPRSGLPVTNGTLLFNGRKDGDRYSGTAFVFSTNCSARGYAVNGPVASDKRSITLYGKAPQVDSSCRVIGYRDDILVFTFQDASTAGQDGRIRREVLVIGRNATIPHADLRLMLFGKKVPLDEMHPEDPGHDGGMVVALSGIEPSPFAVRRSTGLRNGFATVLCCRRPH
jgi:hypothetical protein